MLLCIKFACLRLNKTVEVTISLYDNQMFICLQTTHIIVIIISVIPCYSSLYRSICKTTLCHYAILFVNMQGSMSVLFLYWFRSVGTICLLEVQVSHDFVFWCACKMSLWYTYLRYLKVSYLTLWCTCILPDVYNHSQHVYLSLKLSWILSVHNIFFLLLLCTISLWLKVLHA